MKTDKTTIFDLFERQRRYVVPLFQRGYVWTRDDQWAPLWDDLVAQAAQVWRHRSSPDVRLPKHFLGAVVLQLVHGTLRQTPMVEIIDGQQRLTTLQLLLIAIRDQATDHLSEYAKRDLERLTVNPPPYADDQERLKVWPTSALQRSLEDVLDAGSPEALEATYAQFHRFRFKKWDPPRPATVEAYLYFAGCVREYLDDDPEELPLDLVDLTPEERADVLVDALLRHIQLVTIELEQEDDAQVIFETLNARGAPLTPSDLVRNFIFLAATRERLDIEKLYQQGWRAFEEDPPERPFWKQEERQGRLKRSRMDLFLFHYVAFRLGEEFTIGHLYQSFREWWEQDDRDIEHEVRELQRYAGIYRELLAPGGTTRFGRFAARLRTLDTTTVYPLVLWAGGELGVESAEFEGIITDIESFLVRRAVCGYHQKAYNRFFLEMFGELRSDGAPPSRAAVRRMLTASDAETMRWPSDAEFEQHLTTSPLYRSFRPGRVQMLLEALNLASVGRFGEHIEVKSALSVEHVLPQNALEQDWPLEVGEDGDIDQAAARRSIIVHRLGNLTLLTQPMNSSVSNGPFNAPHLETDKRREIPKSQLALNTYFSNVDRWGDAAIDERSRKLASVALRVWPGPNAAAPTP